MHPSTWTILELIGSYVVFLLLAFFIYAHIWAWWKWTHRPAWPYYNDKHVARWAKKYYNADGTRNGRQEIRLPKERIAKPVDGYHILIVLFALSVVLGVYSTYRHDKITGNTYAKHQRRIDSMLRREEQQRIEWSKQ